MKKAILLSVFLFLNLGSCFLIAQDSLEIDPSYGFDGTNEFWLEIDGITHELKVADSYMMPNNKLLCAGNTEHCYHDWKNYGVLFIMDQSGKLDTSYFDGMGYRRYTSTTAFSDLLVAPDGDFLLIDVSKIIKINLETGIDETFANEGSLNLGFKGSAMYFDPAGDLLVRGWQYNWSSPDNRDRLLAKYSVEAVLDSTFGTNGVLHVFPTESANYFNNIQFDSAGNYYLIGTSRYDYNFVDRHILVTKLFPNGDRDSSYADGGQYEDSNIYRSSNGHAYVTDQDELIVRGSGDTDGTDNGAWQMLMLKIDASGALDTTFGTNGYSFFDYPTGSAGIHFFEPLQSGGFIFGGSGGYPDRSLFLARCSDNGILDLNYGIDGFRYYTLPEYTFGMTKAYLVGNKLVAHGVSSNAACAQTMYKSWFRRFSINELNDNCWDAASLAVYPPSACPESATSGSVAYCTAGASATDCSPDSVPDVFYTFNTDSLGSVLLDFQSENDDIYVLELLESCGGNSVWCMQTSDTALTLELSTDASYLIRVASDAELTADETFTICLTQFAEPATLSGTLDWVGDCSPDTANFAFYCPGTDSLLFTAESPLSPGGEYAFPIDSVGTFDCLIYVEGFLTKGFADVLIQSGENILDAQLQANGDINGDGSINLADISFMSTVFLTQLGEPNFNAAADLDCNSSINLLDVSLFSDSFLQEDDTVPLE